MLHRFRLWVFLLLLWYHQLKRDFARVATKLSGGMFQILIFHIWFQRLWCWYTKSKISRPDVVALLRYKAHKWSTVIETVKNETIFRKFFFLLYFYQNVTKSRKAIYHSIARNLLYKTVYRSLLNANFFCTKKLKKKISLQFLKIFFLCILVK